jgi:hypothetical protein
VKADLFSSGAIAPITVRQIGDELIQTINARDIHRKPQVGRDFSNWIKDRIGTQFKENVDFSWKSFSPNRAKTPKVEDQRSTISCRSKWLSTSYAGVRQLAGRQSEVWGVGSAADKLFMIKSE